MITVNIRKQGTAAVITIPDIVMKTLDISAGSTLELDISDGAFIARPVRNPARRRYTLAELLCGVAPETLAALQEETDWAREGESVGREIA